MAFSRPRIAFGLGVPGFLLYPIQPIYIIQSPKEVLMIWQLDHQARHVYLTDKHSARVKPSWYGESIGQYDGDTLVIDTVGIDTRTLIDDFETPHTDKLHVERFQMIEGGMTLDVSVRVEDTGAFTTTWNAIQHYRRSAPGRAENSDPFNPVLSSTRAGSMIEASCVENPMSNFGNDADPIPRADKPNF